VERFELAQAVVVLRCVQVFTRWKGVAFVQEAYRRLPASRPPIDPSCVARRFGVASTIGPWPPRCVHRALATWGALHRVGLRPELHHGVSLGPGRRPEFHVWVTVDGKAYDSPELLGRYELLEPTMVPQPETMR
jgi:hypothetical protein